MTTPPEPPSDRPPGSSTPAWRIARTHNPSARTDTAARADHLGRATPGTQHRRRGLGSRLRATTRPG